jgi:hypothetical protein
MISRRDWLSGTIGGVAAVLTGVAFLRSRSAAPATPLAEAHTVNPRDFGARGDGVADDTGAFRDAEAHAHRASLPLLISRGVYLLNNLSTRVSVELLPGATLRSVPRPGHPYGVLIVEGDGVTITGGEINGAGACRAIVVNGSTGAMVRAVRLRDSFEAALSAHYCTDLTVERCDIARCRGGWADGIYFAGCSGSSALENRIVDFQRIGVVAESEGDTTSRNTRVIGNHIEHAHDSIGTEYNGGVWLENAAGGEIRNNTLVDLNNRPAQRAWGITLGPGSREPHSVVIAENRILGDVDAAIVVSDSEASVQIHDSLVEGPYRAGVFVTAARSVSIARIDFGETDFTAGANGTLLIDATVPIERIEVEDLRIGRTSHRASDSAEINVYGGGRRIGELVLKNVSHGRLLMREPVQRLSVSGGALEVSGAP